MAKPLTYGELLERLNSLHPLQLKEDVVIAKGRKVYPLHDTALSCECSGPAVELVGENVPVLIIN